jgi:hypothetical protein
MSPRRTKRTHRIDTLTRPEECRLDAKMPEVAESAARDEERDPEADTLS